MDTLFNRLAALYDRVRQTAQPDEHGGFMVEGGTIGYGYDDRSGKWHYYVSVMKRNCGSTAFVYPETTYPVGVGQHALIYDNVVEVLQLNQA